MAYRGNNLLLMEQRRAAIEDAQRQRQNQNIQQAMAVAEDIKNQQFERQRQQAEVHGKLAEQLMMKREPFAKAPIEESAMLGQMQAMADRQKMMSQQQREEDKRQAQKDRDAAERAARIKLERIRNRGRGGSGSKLGQMLTASVALAKNRENKISADLSAARKGDSFARKDEALIKRLEEELVDARQEHFKVASLKDKADMGYGLDEVMKYLGAHKRGRNRQSFSDAGTPPGMPPGAAPPQQPEILSPDEVTEYTPVEQIADPVLKNLAARTQTDVLSQGIEETKQRKKLQGVKDELFKFHQDKVGQLADDADYGFSNDFSEKEIGELASMFVNGGEEIRMQMRPIIQMILTDPDRGLPMTKGQWEKAVQSVLIRKRGDRQKPTRKATQTSQAPVTQGGETDDEAFDRLYPAAE